MGFFKRIARGWHLMSYSFMSIYKEQPQLITAALLICAVPVVLFFIGALVLGQFASFTQWLGWSTLDLSQLRVPEYSNWYMIVGGSAIGLLIAFFYILYIMLLYFFKAFLQDKHISFKAAFKAVLSRMPFILLWVILEMLGRQLLLRAIPIQPLMYTILYAIWVWLTLFVVPILALEKTNILNVLRTSATIALNIVGDIIGANLWLLFVVFMPSVLAAISAIWLASQAQVLTATSAGFALALLGIYLVSVFVVILAFANVLFTVALYLLSTEQETPHIPARIKMLYGEHLVPDEL